MGKIKTQIVVIEGITSFTMTNKYPPTVRELAEIAGVSISTLHGHLKRLKLRGRINWETGSPRTLRILDQEGEQNAD